MVEAEIGTLQFQAKEHQGLLTNTWSQRRQGKVLPSSFKGIMALLIPWFQTSTSPNCERINFCCPKIHRLWYFILLQQPYHTNSWETWTKVLTVLRIRFLCVLFKKFCCILQPSEIFISLRCSPKNRRMRGAVFLTGCLCPTVISKNRGFMGLNSISQSLLLNQINFSLCSFSFVSRIFSRNRWYR